MDLPPCSILVMTLQGRYYLLYSRGKQGLERRRNCPQSNLHYSQGLINSGRLRTKAPLWHRLVLTGSVRPHQEPAGNMRLTILLPPQQCPPRLQDLLPGFLPLLPGIPTTLGVSYKPLGTRSYSAVRQLVSTKLCLRANTPPWTRATCKHSGKVAGQVL